MGELLDDLKSLAGVFSLFVSAATIGVGWGWVKAVIASLEDRVEANQKKHDAELEKSMQRIGRMVGEAKEDARSGLADVRSMIDNESSRMFGLVDGHDNKIHELDRARVQMSSNLIHIDQKLNDIIEQIKDNRRVISESLTKANTASEMARDAAFAVRSAARRLRKKRSRDESEAQ